MRRTIFMIVLAIAPLAAGQRRRAVNPPTEPPCLTVDGTPAVTFTRDEGRTLAPTTERLEGIGYTYGLAALDTPRTIARDVRAGNRDLMYFVFGTYFQGYGTDLFRYDDATRTLTKTHNDYNDINAIAFSRDRPGVMYLGLETEMVR